MSGESFEECFGFVAEQPVAGADKGGEVSSVGETCLEVFAFLDMFSAFEDVGVGAASVSFTISVDDSNVNNAICARFP